jgi:hypothetical protein
MSSTTPVASGSCPGFELSYDAWGQLVLTDPAGATHVGVDPVRAFPISDPLHSVSILAADGHEVLWIDRLADVPDSVRGILAEELARREFVPVLRRILHVSANSEPCEWDVETDRGRTRFLLKTDDDVRRLDDRRAMIIDAHGVRYLIPDLAALDGYSHHILERYL